MAESPKFLNLIGNLGREHYGDVRFLTGSWNMAISRMHNEKKYAIWPLLVAESSMNLAMGQIRCSTEHISCLFFSCISSVIIMINVLMYMEHMANTLLILVN